MILLGDRHGDKRERERGREREGKWDVRGAYLQGMGLFVVHKGGLFVGGPICVPHNRPPGTIDPPTNRPPPDVFGGGPI